MKIEILEVMKHDGLMYRVRVDGAHVDSFVDQGEAYACVRRIKENHAENAGKPPIAVVFEEEIP